MSWTDHGLRPLRSTLKHNCFCTSGIPEKPSKRPDKWPFHPKSIEIPYVLMDSHRHWILFWHSGSNCCRNGTTRWSPDLQTCKCALFLKQDWALAPKMEKALSRFHTCTELLKVFAETVKNQAISCVTDTQTHWQSVIPLQAASTCGRWSVNLWQRAAELHHFKKYPVHGRASSPLHSNKSSHLEIVRNL